MKAFLKIFAVSTLLTTAAVCYADSRLSVYSPAGKRDPFMAPAVTPAREINASLSPTERFSLEQFQLRAIVKGIGRDRAMFEDPENNSYILYEGDTIGRERASISRILDTGVIVTERTFNYLGEESLYEKVLSLPSDPNELALRDQLPAAPIKSRGEREVTASPDYGRSVVPVPPDKAVEKSVESQVKEFVSPTQPTFVSPMYINPMVVPVTPRVPNATAIQQPTTQTP